MKYKDRDFPGDIILLPGWATDHRIFDRLDIPYNYYLPEKCDPQNFEKDCLSLIKESSLDKVSLFGWSMGGFAAADFASKHPDKISKLILASVKEKYKKEDLDHVRKYLKEGRKAYLYKFYNETMSGSGESVTGWFKNELMKDYFNKFGLQELLDGLDYLETHPLNVNKLKAVKIDFLYGKKDKIVPVGEIIQLKNKLPQGEFIFIENKGHIPFI